MNIIDTSSYLSQRLNRARILLKAKKQFAFDIGEPFGLQMPCTKLPKRNSSFETLKYLNDRYFLGIQGLDLISDDEKKKNDDIFACILHDLTHQPLDMVVERLYKYGFNVF